MRSVEELETKLASPSADLIQDLRKVEGNIMILGAGGKMGPSLATLAKNAAPDKEIRAVSRFSDPSQVEKLEKSGIKTFAGDLLEKKFLDQLPETENVVFMAGQKFGTLGNESVTWAMNSYLPGLVADRFSASRLVVFSTGNVYPLVSVTGPGSSEDSPVGPIGEYAQSCLGRERVFEYFSTKFQIPMVIFRLNYALDLRYGVLNEIARAVWEGRPIDLTMGYVNVIWQGDANSFALRSLLLAASPPKYLNVTGPEVISTLELAKEFARIFDREPKFKGKAETTALLSDSSETRRLMGPPSVSLGQMIDWTAQWVRSDGHQLGKPTHFQERTGQF